MLCATSCVPYSTHGSPEISSPWEVYGCTALLQNAGGIHFVQEDSPDEIGQALREWMLAR